MVGLEEGHHVLDRGVDLDIVGRADDVAASFLGRIQGVLRHGLDILGFAQRKDVLDVHSALEGDVFAEFLFQFLDIHIGGLGLEGLQDVEAALDEVRDELLDVSAGVVHDRDLVLVGDIDVGLEGLFEVLSPHVEAEQWAGLGADVVAHHEDVDFTLDRLEDAVIVFDEVVDDVIADVLNDLGVHHHVDEDLLDAPQVHHRLELGRAVQPVAHVDDAVFGMIDHAIGLDLRIIPPVGTGPVVVFFDFFQRFHFFEGRLGNLGVASLVGCPLSVDHGLAFDPPEVLDRSVGMLFERLTHIARPVVVAEVDPQEVEQFLIVVATEVLHRLLLDLRDHPVVDRDPVGFLMS